MTDIPRGLDALSPALQLHAVAAVERPPTTAAASQQQRLRLEQVDLAFATSTHGASSSSCFLRQASSASPVSPFSVPVASLGLQPPAAISEQDAALLSGCADGQAATARRAQLKQQETLLQAPSPAEVAEAATQQGAGAAAVAAAAAAAAGASSCSSLFNLGPGPCGASEPILASCGSSRGRLPSCATSLAALASDAAGGCTGQGALLCAVPPHGVKAVCGKRAKMEDAFSVQCNFCDVQLSSADTTEYGNKLPARIASQVGEQLEVPPAQPQASSPPTSLPLSPNSTCVPSLSNSDHEPSVGGSATSSDASDGSSSSSSSAGSGCDTLHFFAVYDGHGGVEAAQHCANRLHHHLSAALYAIAGPSVTTTLHSQDALCMTSRTQGAGCAVTSTSTTTLHCEAEWALCPSPCSAAPTGPERSTDSLVAPPPGMLLALSHARGATGDAGAGGGEEESSSTSSQAQQAVDRLFRSSDGVVADNPAAPSPPPSGPVQGTGGTPVGAGAAAAVADAGGSDGDASSHTSGGDAARSESAGAVCMTEALEAALRSAFLRTDEEFAEDGSSAMVGSTAVVALVGTKRLWIANCGDSRAVLCRGGRAIQVTDDHKPEREDEAERVEKAGGQVLYWNGHRVMGVLAMSRAIGDHGLRPYVIPEPEITVLSRVADDDFLLLASDGLWDVMSNQEAITLALRCLQRSRDKGTSRKAAVRVAATVLTRAAVDRGSKDNITVVIIDLKAPEPGDGAGPVGPNSNGATCANASGSGAAAVAAAAGACTCGGEPGDVAPPAAVPAGGTKLHPLAAALRQETILRGSAAVVEAAAVAQYCCVRAAVGRPAEQVQEEGEGEGEEPCPDDTLLGGGSVSGNALREAMAAARAAFAAAQLTERS